MIELLIRRIVAIQPAPAGTDPQEIVPILIERHDKVSAQAVLVGWVVPKDFELVSIRAIQPIERAEPHEALAVTDDTQHPVVGEAVLRGEMVEAEILVGGRRGESVDCMPGKWILLLDAVEVVNDNCRKVAITISMITPLMMGGFSFFCYLINLDGKFSLWMSRANNLI
ncbi:MAG: hypothetical protein WBD62_16445 [Anaerolineales bacterium]|nr:hypothetical protein [Anaerolineales bacterium]